MEHFPLQNKLHTDVLEEKYGPIHAEVVRHDSEIREAKLVDGEGITRTYAITFFPKVEFVGELSEVNEKIKNGGAIGKVFREYGYVIRKNVIDVFIVDLPTRLQQDFQTHETKAKARLSEFYARKEQDEPIVYGTVLEIYSPDFRPPEINKVDQAQNNVPTESFEVVGITKRDVWDHLGNNNDWSDNQERRQQAIANSNEDEKLVREKILLHLSNII